jgi:alpha-beta hydrolase superfamily lysophospholipase
MAAWLIRRLRQCATLLGLAIVILLGVRAYNSQRGPPLGPWHTYVPHELSAGELDQKNWPEYLKTEDSIFSGVRTEVTGKLAPEERLAVNRYFDGSPIYPGHFSQNWNRSYLLEPEGTPAGAAVFLHGLTDSPYSLRHIARTYHQHGFVCVGIRLPGHGTVPGALTKIEWEDWLAATRLAVREARKRAGPSVPLHLVGFSNGGALALMYALDALGDPGLARPERLVLISPMIGITRFARFAGVAGWPSIFPAFAKAAWLGLLPEFNPFKYNSFPVNGARQSYLLTEALQKRIVRYVRDGRLGELPPILTFQSVMDSTVSTRAIVSALYAHLPANGSELVLFDLNRSAKFGPLLRSASDTLLSRLLPDPPRRFRATIITNANPNSNEVVEKVTEAGATEERSRDLGLSFPAGVFSLSHVALPFPLNDALYGLQPDPSEDFGVNLGALGARGELGTLVVSMDLLVRMTCNPFFPYLIGRIEEGIPPSQAPSPASNGNALGSEMDGKGSATTNSTAQPKQSGSADSLKEQQEHEIRSHSRQQAVDQAHQWQTSCPTSGDSSFFRSRLPDHLQRWAA